MSKNGNENRRIALKTDGNLPILSGKDAAIGRGRITAALGIDEKLCIADIPVDSLQISGISLPFAERNARIVDKQLMAPAKTTQSLEKASHRFVEIAITL